MKQVIITCDGSSLGNGFAGARAGAVAILTYTSADGKPHNRVVGEYLGCATNNQAEIVAAAVGLEALKEPCEVDVVTDSRYVVDTMNGVYRMKKNHEYWARLKDAALPHVVTWHWTRGHAGHPLQEICDIGAKEIAAAGRVDQALLDRLARSIPKSGAKGATTASGLVARRDRRL